MNRIDEMISRLGYKKVKKSKIADCCTAVFAGGTPSTANETYYDGTIPWIRSGEIDFNRISKSERNITKEGLANSSAKMIRPKSVVMAMTGATVAKVATIEAEISANQSVCAMEPNDLLHYRFLYFYLAANYHKLKNSAQGALTSLNLQRIKDLEIPLPPLAIQQEIVSVLDSFTSLIEKMKEEVALRKKQIEYYREKLMTFDAVEGNSVKWLKLSDVCLYSKDKIDASDLPENSYIGVENLLKNKQGRTESTVVPLGSVIKYEKNDILIGNIRPNLRKIWKSDSMGGTNGDVLCIRIKEDATKELSSDYLFHILASENFFEYDIKYSKGAKMPRGDKTSIMKYLIPIPPLDQQHRIASTLDLFETYITKLERLIELRQKQYEYYRDQLLTFE